MIRKNDDDHRHPTDELIEYQLEPPDSELVVRGRWPGVEWHARNNTLYIDAVQVISWWCQEDEELYRQMYTIAYVIDRTICGLQLDNPTITITDIRS